ncbi:MAG: hypothetical protein ACRYGR_05695 [Janthinobacterium lividum]
MILTPKHFTEFMLLHMGRFILYGLVASLLSDLYLPLKPLLMGSAAAVAAYPSICILVKRNACVDRMYYALVLMSLAYLCSCLSGVLHHEEKAGWLNLNHVAAGLFYGAWGLMEFYVCHRLKIETQKEKSS